MTAMNDVKMDKHGKGEENDILYKNSGHLTKDRDGISIFKELGFQRPELSKRIKRRLEVISESDSQYSRHSKAGASLWPPAAQCDCKQQIFYYYCCPKFKSAAMELENGKLVTPAKKAFHFCHVLFFISTLFEISRVPMILLEKLG